MNFELKQTTDYTIFRTGQNREVKEKDVKRKLISIQEDGLQLPIVVNRRMEIVDGQHRFQALVMLGEPVPYLVSNNWKNEYHTAVINNTQRTWSTENWAEFRAKENPVIAQALLLAENYRDITYGRMTIATALEMMSIGGTSIITDLKNNKYAYDNERGNEIYQILSIVAEYPNNMRNPYNQKIVRAMKMMLDSYSYINKKAIARMANDNFITNYSNERDMYNYIKNIYNKALKKK